jgi:hypothetical protein
MLGTILSAVISAVLGFFGKQIAHKEEITEARETGQLEVVAKENQKAAEVTDAMAKAADRPSDDDVTNSMRSGDF